MATKTSETETTAVDELHPDGAEQPSDAASSSSTRKTTAKAKRVSGRQAIAKVLADGNPRPAGEITAAAVKLIRPKPQGKTPEATLGALLYTEAKKDDGLVTRTGSGRDTRFTLRAQASA